MTMAMTMDVGMVGLGVMGRNLALNLTDHGYSVCGFDLDPNAAAQLEAEWNTDGGNAAASNTRGTISGTATMQELIASLRPPRIIIVLVPAGIAVDAVCGGLIAAGAQPNDIVIDCGNSLWTDTIRREEVYRDRITFFGSGISGGEVGARFGPSLMPGGDRAAWARLEPIWNSIAAKVDPHTGREIEGATPGNPVEHGEPCTAYIGANGAGHYVKMVHNGIEYADMQLICEAYHLLRAVGGLQPHEISAVFAEWNRGELDSYLIEITADILQQRDPVTGLAFVDVVLDRAGQKGTGKWTAVNALDLGIPAMTIAEAVFARGMSALKTQRVDAARLRAEREDPIRPAGVLDGEALITCVHAALYCGKLCSYAQGFQLMQAAQEEYNWQLEFASIARIWRGGCIIRARFLQLIADAFARYASLPNLLLDAALANAVVERAAKWRAAVQQAVACAIPVPALSSALAYYDGYHTATLPANLLQAQRDYFGAHTYERVDEPRGRFFHLDWPEEDRPQIAG
ncbi:MAG: NADP-dependent phosphogluconate dehydrogenase [Phycisphaerales bacterium]